jgi:hypothetical protein
MPRSFTILLMSVWLAAAGCGESDPSTVDATTSVDTQSCGVTGRSFACAGPGGCDGVQTCRADGTFAACKCSDEPAPDCGESGIVVTCVGPDSCLGIQACQVDGRYTECQCVPPPVVPDAGVPDVSVRIGAPKKDAVLAGSVVIKGTAGADALAVGVSIAGSPFITAKGTETWSLTVDTTQLPNGPATIVVAARAQSGLENVVQRAVTIDNTDPIVGAWRGLSIAQQECTLYFFASGNFVDQGCGFNGLTRWLRESEDLVVLSGDNWGNDVIAPSFSMAKQRMTLLHNGTTRQFTRVDPTMPDLPDADGGVDDGGAP